jgi:hypothetical protein
LNDSDCFTPAAPSPLSLTSIWNPDLYTWTKSLLTLFCGQYQARPDSKSDPTGPPHWTSRKAIARAHTVTRTASKHLTSVLKSKPSRHGMAGPCKESHHDIWILDTYDAVPYVQYCMSDLQHRMELRTYDTVLDKLRTMRFSRHRTSDIRHRRSDDIICHGKYTLCVRYYTSPETYRT